MSKSVSVMILGQTFSKSNSRIFSYNNGNPRMFKRAVVQQYVTDAILQLKSQLRDHTVFEGPVRIDVTIYYQSRRSDLDVSLIQDIFQEKVDKKSKLILFKGVYKNDRQVEEIHAIRKIDKDNPRVEAVITEI